MQRKRCVDGRGSGMCFNVPAHNVPGHKNNIDYGKNKIFFQVLTTELTKSSLFKST